jgi:hypothetical protein
MPGPTQITSKCCCRAPRGVLSARLPFALTRSHGMKIAALARIVLLLIGAAMIIACRQAIATICRANFHRERAPEASDTYQYMGDCGSSRHGRLHSSLLPALTRAWQRRRIASINASAAGERRVFARVVIPIGPTVLGIPMGNNRILPCSQSS